jgi:hypothetical protein
LSVKRLIHATKGPRVNSRSRTRMRFTNRGGKASHWNYVHDGILNPITISGELGDDAKSYQIRAVRKALEEIENER